MMDPPIAATPPSLAPAMIPTGPPTHSPRIAPTMGRPVPACPLGTVSQEPSASPTAP